MTQLQEALQTEVAADTVTAIFFCDLDRLKLVNDGHGHAVGDAYIREVSRRIRASVRETDIVGRLSGDEFVVILRGVRARSEVIALAARVVEGVREPLRLGGVNFTPSLSLGIAYGAGTSTTADELLAQADTAMYRAKLEERGAWYVYDATMSNSAAAELQLRNDVAEALEQEQFVLHYQPIVRLPDRAVMGREALLRWQHPKRGLLLPSAFLDVILDSEYESPVTDWVMRRACLDAASYTDGSRKVSVNVSSLQVGRSDLPEVVSRCLAESGLDPSDLVLELTEDRLLSRPDGSELLDRPARARRVARDRRLRHRLRRARLPPALLLDRHRQARPQLRRRTRPRADQRAHRPRDARADPGLRAAAGDRGRGDRSTGQPASAARCDACPGLPVRPADAARPGRDGRGSERGTAEWVTMPPC